jgi:hypothetical protein
MGRFEAVEHRQQQRLPGPKAMEVARVGLVARSTIVSSTPRALNSSCNR